MLKMTDWDRLGRLINDLHTLTGVKFALLDENGLAEYGTHEELMALGGKYYEMFTVQGRYYSEHPTEVGA